MEQIEKLEFEHGELQQTVKEKLNVIEVQEKDFRMFSRKIQSQQAKIVYLDLIQTIAAG